MIVDGPTTRILGLAVLIAVSGCGSESSRPPVPPLAASPDRVPPAAPPASPPDDPPVRLNEIATDPPTRPRLYFQYGEPLRAPAVATGDPELDPLVSFLKVSYAEEIKDGHRLVIMDTPDLQDLTLGDPYPGLEDELLGDVSDQVPAEMIRDFCEKNRKPRAIWPELTRHLPAVLLSAEERKAIFSIPAQDVWQPFYTKYPGSPGIITVSRVGLNRDKTVAIFYVGCLRHLLNGMGGLRVFKKEGDVWVDTQIAIGPYWSA